MSKTTVDLEIQSRVAAAVKRMIYLRECGYLPKLLEDDLKIVIEAAMCWDLYQQQTKQYEHQQ